VIEKELRDQLGIGPGWTTIQEVVDDHLEVRFIPPPHRRSLFGVLAPYTAQRFPTEEELQQAIEEAWEIRATEVMSHLDDDQR